MKPWVFLTGCFMLSVALIAFSFCHRYSVVVGQITETGQLVFIRVDHFSGKTMFSHSGVCSHLFEMIPWRWVEMDFYKEPEPAPNRKFTPPPLSSEETTNIPVPPPGFNLVK